MSQLFHGSLKSAVLFFVRAQRVREFFGTCLLSCSPIVISKNFEALPCVSLPPTFAYVVQVNN